MWALCVGCLVSIPRPAEPGAGSDPQQRRWQDIAALNEVEYEPVPERRKLALEGTTSVAHFGSFGSFGSHALTSLVTFIPSYASLPVASPLLPPSPLPPPNPSVPPLPASPPPPPASPGQTLEGLGCTDPEADNYDAGAVREDGSCTYDVIVGCTDSNALNYISVANADSGNCLIPVYGCPVPSALNYNPEANVYDPLIEACDLTVQGCTDSTKLGYNPEASVDDGSCIDKVFGCMSEHAVNFDSSANAMDASTGACTYVDYGCTDQTALNYNPLATEEHPSGLPPYVCVPNIAGCMAPLAINYVPAATNDDGSCYTPTLLSAAVAAEPCFMPACTTTLTTGCALNSAVATLNQEAAALPNAPASCAGWATQAGCYFCGALLPAVAAIPDGTGGFVGERAWLGAVHSFLTLFCTGEADPSESCSTIVDGCLVPSASNFNPAATMQILVTCEFATRGCKDSSALSFNSLAEVHDASQCTYVKEGCTLRSSATFDVNATEQCLPISSCCIFDKYGCTEEAALTFDFQVARAHESHRP